MGDSWFFCPDCQEELEQSSDPDYLWCPNCKEEWPVSSIKPKLEEYYKEEDRGK